MAFEAPTAGEIRTAKGQAVGGGRKRCKKGKNCSAACIQAGMYCLVDMPEPAAVATGKVAGMLEKRMSGKLPAPAAPTAEKLKPMAAAPRGKTEAKKQTTAQKGSDLLKQLQAEGKAQKATPAKPTSATPGAGKAASNVPGPASGDWRTRFNGITPQLDFELNKLQQSIDKLPPEQQAYWNKQIQEKFGLKGSVPVHTNGKPYTESEIAKAYVSQARGWNGMIKDGAPKMLADREVGTFKAPKGMIPDTTFTGQRKWISPQDGLVYSAPKTPADKAAGVWGQNRAATKDTLRRLPEITDFRRGQRERGENWPTQQLPPRPGLPKTVDEVIAKLTPEDKAAIMFNGLNKTDKEGKLLIEWYKANPQQAEARFRETVQRWYDQGGRSGISGMPVAIPGLKAKEGEARSSVDHFNPISTGKAFTAADLRKQLDNYKNFLVAEEGPNSNRSNKPWDSWLDNKEKSGAKTPKAKTPTPKSPNKGQKEKASTAPPVKGQPSASPKSSGVEKIQKIADDQKLERLRAQEEEYKKRWVETIGKGSKENTERAWATYGMVKKEYEDFKKEYDDKYNRPVAKSPKELMAQESKRVRDRIEGRIKDGQTYSKEINAQIQADGEKKYAPFKKLSNDELASLELYGENKVKYYMDVNKFLRTGSMEGIPAERQQIVRNIVSNLNSTLDKLPASGERNFARAVSGVGATNLANLKVGDVITDKGFGSYTTPDRVRTLDQFYNPNAPNAAMRVTSRNARNVAPVMPFEREDEHMLKPGTRLRVVQIIGADDPNAERSRKVGKIPTYIFEEVE